jgi:hypothetical protein
MKIVLGRRLSPVSVLLSMMSKPIGRSESPPSADANLLMMSHYFIAPRSLPQHLPQQFAFMVLIWVPSAPRPRLRS